MSLSRSFSGGTNAQTSLARLPPLTSLRAFVATARHLSFQGAADELHVTSAAIGQQVRLLEVHLGQSLFNRVRGKLELTDTGRRLMPGLTDAFNAVVESVAQVVAGEDEGPVRVSVAPSFASKWLIPRLDALRRAVPGLEIQLDSTSRLAELDGSEADCAIRYGKGEYPGLDVEGLFAEAVIPVCSPGFAHEHGLHAGIDDLGDVALLHEDGVEYDASCPNWFTWLRANGLAHAAPAQGIRMSQSAMLVDAAVAGQGLALAKLRLIEADLKAGRLVIPFGRPHPVQFSYFFATSPQAARLDRVRLFREWLQAEAARERSKGFQAAPHRPSLVWDRLADSAGHGFGQGFGAGPETGGRVSIRQAGAALSENLFA